MINVWPALAASIPEQPVPFGMAGDAVLLLGFVGAVLWSLALAGRVRDELAREAGRRAAARTRLAARAAATSAARLREVAPVLRLLRPGSVR